MSTVDAKARVLYFQGRRALDMIESRKLALTLKIFFPQLEPEPVELMAAETTKQDWVSKALDMYFITEYLIGDEKKISSADLARIRAGQFYWHEPVIAVLAKHSRCYHFLLIQALCEKYAIDLNGQSQLYEETGLTDVEIGPNINFGMYDAINERENAWFVRNRENMTLRQLQGSPLYKNDQQLLQNAGGLISEYLKKPIFHMYYLFSRGDVSSVAVYCIRHNISSTAFIQGYQEWVKDMYGIILSMDTSNINVSSRLVAIKFNHKALGRIISQMRGSYLNKIMAL